MAGRAVGRVADRAVGGQRVHLVGVVARCRRSGRSGAPRRSRRSRGRAPASPPSGRGRRRRSRRRSVSVRLERRAAATGTSADAATGRRVARTSDSSSERASEPGSRSSIVPSIDATRDCSLTRPKRITASEKSRPSAAQSRPGDWIVITWPERSVIASPGAQLGEVQDVPAAVTGDLEDEARAATGRRLAPDHPGADEIDALSVDADVGGHADPRRWVPASTPAARRRATRRSAAGR